MSYWIRTATGKRFDLANPTPATIDFEDIALGLSRAARFNGQTPHFYSVAQHSVIASRNVNWAGEDKYDIRVQRYALMHDAAEAYIGDISRPLKAMMGPQIHRIEQNIMLAICDEFGIETDPVEWNHVHNVDDMLLSREVMDFFGEDPAAWGLQAAPLPLRGARIFCLPEIAAKIEFYDRAKELGIID